MLKSMVSGTTFTEKLNALELHKVTSLMKNEDFFFSFSSLFFLSATKFGSKLDLVVRQTTVLTSTYSTESKRNTTIYFVFKVKHERLWN